MASARSLFGRAAAAHRQARGLEQAARSLLEQAEEASAGLPLGDGPGVPGPGPGAPRSGGSAAGTVSRSQAELAGLVERLRAAGEALTPGWWTASWDAPLADRGIGTDGSPGRWSLLRVGSSPVGEGFPVVVPFIGAGQLSVDADAGDLRVAGFVRSVLLRVLAAMPAGSVRVLAVDGGGLGTTFTPLRPLIAAGLMSEPATDLDGLRRVLAEAEQRVRLVQVDGDPGPLLLVTVAALPVGLTRSELSRISALCQAGASAGVHLLVAGLPAEAPVLPETTPITRWGEAFRVGEPPGAERFGVAGEGLAAPVLLDTGPPGRLLAAVCGRIAERTVEQAAVQLSDLLPDELGTGSSAAALATPIGRTSPVGQSRPGLAVLRLDAATPHWLVSGRTGSGTTPVLLDLLAGLISRYPPDELGLYLLDFADGVCFAELVPTELDATSAPQVRAVGIECDREYGVAVLAAVAAEATRRVAAMKQAGVGDLAQLRAARPLAALPRLVVAIEEYGRLFGPDPGSDAIPLGGATGGATGVDGGAAVGTGDQAPALLAEILRRSGECGIHLVFTAGTGRPDEPPPELVAGFGQVTVTGPDTVLLEGRQVFVPVADPDQVKALRSRLWLARPPGHPDPARYDGSAELHVADDPQAQQLGTGARRRVVLLGRAVELATPAVRFTLDSSPGRHLVVVGPSPVGSDLLHAAVWQLCRQHRAGTARIVLAGLVAAADAALEDCLDVARMSGHDCRPVDAAGLRQTVQQLAGERLGGQPDAEDPATYLVVFGGDGVLGAVGPTDPLATVLREGPAAGVHLVGWWREPSRFAADLSPAAAPVAAVVELAGRPAPGPNRALFLDRQEGRRQLFIPFVRPGRSGESL